MEIKFCEKGDQQIAIGTGKRPIQFCRDHYIEECGGEFQQFNVVIPHRDLGIDPEHLAIACAKTGEDITAGTVWLDPVETNIKALIYSGFIEPIPAAPKPAARAERVTEV